MNSESPSLTTQSSDAIEDPVFLGIDLSTVRQAAQGKTYLAFLQEHPQQPPHLQELTPLTTDQALLHILSQQTFQLCGIDAPLSLPPCVCCRLTPCTSDCPYEGWSQLLAQRPDLFYHFRLTDVLLGQALKHISPKPPLSTGGPVDITPLTLRWLRLARQLRAQKAPLDRIIEIYASGTAQLYAWKLRLAENRAFAYRSQPQHRARLLAELQHQELLEISPEHQKRATDSEDAFDALLAALTCWHVARSQWITPHDVLGLGQSPPPIRPLSSKIPQEDCMDMALLLSSGDWIRLPALHNLSLQETLGY